MSRAEDEYKPLMRYEREINELDKIRLRGYVPRPINTEEVIDKDVLKLAREWSAKCAKPLRGYCQSVLTQLGRYFTHDSITAILNEAASRGLSIEAVVILLSQCTLLQCDDTPVRNYLDTGRVDVSTLQAILQSQGVVISPEELRAIIEKQPTKKPSNNKSSWLPRFIKH